MPSFTICDMLAPGAFVQPCPGDRGAGAVAGMAGAAGAAGAVAGELGSEEDPEDLGLGKHVDYC